MINILFKINDKLESSTVVNGYNLTDNPENFIQLERFINTNIAGKVYKRNFKRALDRWDNKLGYGEYVDDNLIRFIIKQKQF